MLCIYTIYFIYNVYNSTWIVNSCVNVILYIFSVGALAVRWYRKERRYVKPGGFFRTCSAFTTTSGTCSKVILKLYNAVLRIHLILMRIRIRILDPHWKKTDPDPGHYFKIYWIFLTKNNFQIFCFIFFAYFYPKTWWIIQIWGHF